MTAANAHSRFVQWVARAIRTTPDKIRRWERLILTALIVTLLTQGAREVDLLRPAEAWWLDRMAYADRPGFGAPIVVVAITEEDYYSPGLFRGTSPLDPDALKRILERVLEHRPKGVILDILIHPAPSESSDRAAARARLFQLLENATDDHPIILVRDLNAEKQERRAEDRNWSTFDELTTRSNLVWACPSIRLSSGIVRAVPQRYEDHDSRALSLQTILGAAVTAFELNAHRSTPWWALHEEDDPTTPRRIRYSGHFVNQEGPVTQHHVTAGLVLSQPVVEGARSLLTDKVVLVGGTFRAGRDALPTAVGSMAGVCVWAEAIASWIRDDALREPRLVFGSALEFLVGILAASLLACLGPALGLLSSVLILIPLTVLFSMLTFGNGILFVNFLPSFVGVYLHYQVEVHWEIRSLKQRVVALSRSAESGPESGDLESEGGER